MMQNMDIRREARASNVKLWQIADALGMADCNFSRKLRKEMNREEKDMILCIIKRLSTEAANDG